jgi:hypothetical protein
MPRDRRIATIDLHSDVAPDREGSHAVKAKISRSTHRRRTAEFLADLAGAACLFGLLYMMLVAAWVLQ